MNLLCALALASIALTPSLVPRPTVFQGFLAGLWFMIGFQLGFLLRWAAQAACEGIRALAQRRGLIRPRSEAKTGRARRRPQSAAGPIVLGIALVAYVVGYGALVVSWQNEVRRLVEMEPVDGAGHAAFLLSMFTTMILFYGIAGGIGALRSAIARSVERGGGSAVLARSAGQASSVAAVLILVVGFLGAGLAAVNTLYEDRDADTPAGISRPFLSERSGGPGSTLTWEGLGRHGRAFSSGGPSGAQIANVTGTPALEPIRVYAGLSQAPDAASRAAAVVDELERTGAFEREVLLVATPTGSGWLEPQAIASFEYLYGGDTATASMQYSTQPSWVSFLFRPGLAVDSSEALFDAVHDRWRAIPEEDRPRLAVYGLSLGAQGMAGSFEGLDDLLTRTDAALFTGPPANSQPWRGLQAARDAESPVWQPVYQAGEQVRWQSKPGDFAELPGPWRQPRIGYLQHATDPITWLEPAVLFQRPAWLAGPAAAGGRGADVSDAMQWIPGVTFLHLVTDMLMSEAVPPSHGHNFGDVAVDGWAQVLPGHDRDGAQLAAIQSIIEQIDSQDPAWE
ncbi:alpha/beta-hydrolase family protein [Nesterenkonia halotolerans]|uniref:Membrane protein n=1 Tax=Nesterenkonia halotolerans TaxID=225325 RepID=A0ABR9J790_9MICC|nr:alpha/beta-hydrolase family protein [Nesterenkonia halotolerans]MBE1514866.1 putative membrane protein [Nesterenkonia halotolerans]